MKRDVVCCTAVPRARFRIAKPLGSTSPAYPPHFCAGCSSHVTFKQRLEGSHHSKVRLIATGAVATSRWLFDTRK